MNEYAPNWIRKDWKTSTGQEPENADLIKLVYAMADLRPAKVVVRCTGCFSDYR